MKWFSKKNDKTGEVERHQEKTKMEFVAKNRRNDTLERKIKVHLEFDMEYPKNVDIIHGIQNTKATFDLPLGIEVRDVQIAHIEILD